MKKALAGPAKRSAKKKPERRAMIAARLRGTFLWLYPRNVPRRARALSRRIDAGVNGLLVRAWGPLVRTGRSARSLAVRLVRRLRPLAVLLFRLLGRIERLLRRAVRDGGRAATRASGALTPQRAICLAIVAAAACLLVAQFVDYRAVEVGQPGYAGLLAAKAPAVGAENAGSAHAYLLVPLAALAAALALVAIANERRRGLGRVVFALGLLALATILLVDLPAGLDAGAAASRFAGAEAVLYDGFYAEIAAAVGLMLGGALLTNAHKVPTRRGCRRRKSSMTRMQGGRRRTRTSSA